MASVENKEYWVYMLECSKGRIYTGYTTDLSRRLAEHREGKKGARFTRSFPPEGLCRAWLFKGSRGDAMRLEAFIKKKSKVQKLGLINNPEILSELASEFMDGRVLKSFCDKDIP